MVTETETEEQSEGVTTEDISEYVAGILALKYDVSQRTIYLMESIDAEVAARFIIVLNFLDNISDEPIRVLLNCPGGEEEAGYAIYDAIRLARCPVLIDGVGMVASIAAVVLQAGDIRRLAENAVFMIHNGSLDLPGTLDQDKIVTISKVIQVNNEKYYQLLSRRSDLSVESIREMATAETFMTAAKAVRVGFADYVWQAPKKKVDKIRQRWLNGKKHAS